MRLTNIICQPAAALERQRVCALMKRSGSRACYVLALNGLLLTGPWAA
jgi:hypothetical protein